MAHSTQARKRIRQNENQRLRNKVRVSRLRTALKAVQAAVQAGDKQKAGDLADKAYAAIDKAAKTNIIHANKAARQKSQVMRAVGAMK